jgi:hypothetical protein
MILFKGMVVWLVFIVLESLNGIVRIIWLTPALGVIWAEYLAFGTGSVLLLAIATLFIRWLKISQRSQLLKVGLLWMFLTLVFEITLGRTIFKYSWQDIAANFNVFKGKLLPVELLLLCLAPAIATKLRETFAFKSG